MTATATKAKTLTKAQEIELIEKLANGGGYWAEYFGADANRMISNIRNDFPIEMKTNTDILKHKLAIQQRHNTELEEAIAKMNEEHQKTQNKLQLANEKLATILGRLIQYQVECEITSPYDFFTFEEIVTVKLHNGIKLESTEATGLINILNRKKQ